MMIPEPRRELQWLPGDVPLAAAWLGGLGLLPFVAGTILIALGHDWAPDALRFYGASILSFMGGVHWGLAIADFGSARTEGTSWLRLGASVLPALVAWIALLLDPLRGLLLLTLAFALLLRMDQFATRRELAPAWYPTLRAPADLGGSDLPDHHCSLARLVSDYARPRLRRPAKPPDSEF